MIMFLVHIFYIYYSVSLHPFVFINSSLVCLFVYFINGGAALYGFSKFLLHPMLCFFFFFFFFFGGGGGERKSE